MKADRNLRLCDVVLDETIGRSTPDVEHEARLRSSTCSKKTCSSPSGIPGAPIGSICRWSTRSWSSGFHRRRYRVATHILSLTPFRRIVKDYFMICESYYQAIRSATPSQIEAIDMGRRGIHNEGSQTLMDRLSGKIRLDFDTARRLFTLVCVLYWRG